MFYWWMLFKWRKFRRKGNEAERRKISTSISNSQETQMLAQSWRIPPERHSKTTVHWLALFPVSPEVKSSSSVICSTLLSCAFYFLLAAFGGRQVSIGFVSLMEFLDSLSDAFNGGPGKLFLTPAQAETMLCVRRLYLYDCVNYENCRVRLLAGK